MKTFIANLLKPFVTQLVDEALKMREQELEQAAQHAVEEAINEADIERDVEMALNDMRLDRLVEDEISNADIPREVEREVTQQIRELDLEQITDKVVEQAREVLGASSGHSLWCYSEVAPNTFAVGFYDPKGTWNLDEIFGRREMAAERVNYLNGGVGVTR